MVSGGVSTTCPDHDPWIQSGSFAMRDFFFSSCLWNSWVATYDSCGPPPLHFSPCRDAPISCGCHCSTPGYGWVGACREGGVWSFLNAPWRLRPCRTDTAGDCFYSVCVRLHARAWLCDMWHLTFRFLFTVATRRLFFFQQQKQCGFCFCLAALLLEVSPSIVQMCCKLCGAQRSFLHFACAPIVD